MKVVLQCPVRGCSEPLNREGTRWVCSRAHSFDQHRHGYLNLLQPQDRRSANPGDSKETALARRRLAALGHAGSLHRALADLIPKSRRPSACLLDVGCGEGAFLRSLQNIQGLELHGLDVSAPSIDIAARAQSDAHFIVANADRGLPYADHSLDFVTAIDSRLNAPEFGRVLGSTGLVLVAVPGPDDLIELRERIQGAKVEKSRTGRVEDAMASRFTVADRAVVRETRVFEADALRDLLAATYRGFRQSERAAKAALTAMGVTLSHEILAFTPR